MLNNNSTKYKIWCRGVDSNHRSFRVRVTVWSLWPLGNPCVKGKTSSSPNIYLINFPKPQLHTICGAGERSRTPDRLITSQLLYQLSYASPNPIYKIGVAILVNVEVIINKLYVIKRFFSVFLHRSGYEREKIAYMVNFM